MHGGELFWIGGRRIVRTDTKLGADLRDQAALAIHLKLQFLSINQDERLTFFYVVADISENLGDAALDL